MGIRKTRGISSSLAAHCVPQGSLQDPCRYQLLNFSGSLRLFPPLYTYHYLVQNLHFATLPPHLRAAQISDACQILDFVPCPVRPLDMVVRLVLLLAYQLLLG